MGSNGLDNAKLIDELLRYLGLSLFEVHDSGSKIVITLHDGSSHWFLYSSRMSHKDLIGEVVHWLMHREYEWPEHLK